jgi:hypothetical protein
MAAELEGVQTDDGRTVYVDHGQVERGAQGPFFVVFVTENRDTRWGYFCGNCDSLDTAMDTMGRVECNVCGNIRKPDEWDAAHE